MGHTNGLYVGGGPFLRVRRAANLLPLGLLLVPLASGAAPAFPMEGYLESAAPMAAAGILLASPDHELRGMVRLEPAGAHDNQTLLQADAARVEILRWENGVRVPDLLGFRPEAASPRVTDRYHAVQLAWLSPHESGQLLLTENEAQGYPTVLTAASARCQILNPAGAGAAPFPQDAEAPHPYSSHRRTGQLQASCQFPSSRIENPRGVALYGVDLWFASAEGARRVRTGTFEEPVSPGAPLTRQVTQILVAWYDGAPFTVEPTPESEATLYASAFDLLGEISSGPSIGALRWGDWSAEGPLAAFQANGAFHVSGGRPQAVALEGQSVEPPPWVSSTEGAMSFLRVGWLAASAVAGVSLSILLLLWSLFSKISPAEAARHPARARILDEARARPGLARNTLARRAGLTPTATYYHVYRLQRGGLLTVHRIQGRTAIFVCADGAPRELNRLALLARPALSRVHAAIAAEPGSTQGTIAARLGLGQSRVSKAVRQLAEAGIIRAEREAAVRRYFPA